MSNYFDARYELIKSSDGLSKVRFYFDEKEDIDTGITFDKLRNAFNYLNNKLLTHDIHLDFEKTRSYLGFSNMKDSMFKAKDAGDNGRKPIIMLLDGDIGASTEEFDVTYMVKVKTYAPADDLTSRLNKSFKQNILQE